MGFNLMTGLELKTALGLDKFKFAYIQKILGAPQMIFVITVDSRRPNIYLSINRVRKSTATTIQKAKRYGRHAYLMMNYRMTPPILIDHTNPIINTGTLVIRRDIGAEYYLNKKMFEDVENNNIEVIDI
jgi:hypothetical protein